MKTYEKPVVSVDTGLAEGVYAASGATQGNLNVDYVMIADRWGTNGGKKMFSVSWSDINGNITLNLNFNDTVDDADTSDSSVTLSHSGNTATFTFSSSVESPLMIGIHLNHGTSIDDLTMTGFTYSVN